MKVSNTLIDKDGKSTVSKKNSKTGQFKPSIARENAEDDPEFIENLRLLYEALFYEFMMSGLLGEPPTDDDLPEADEILVTRVVSEEL